uniref:Uncharacterized protein n=1 Tax=Anser cygnoides TaxID=8845 RepID=A0A8B9D4M5_ANSCY
MDPAALKANPLSGHLCISLFTVLFLKVEIMDKENENAALEATVEMIVANVIREAEYVAKNIQWTTCKDFTVERGRQQIEEYISVSEYSIHS